MFNVKNLVIGAIALVAVLVSMALPSGSAKASDCPPGENLWGWMKETDWWAMSPKPEGWTFYPHDEWGWICVANPTFTPTPTQTATFTPTPTQTATSTPTATPCGETCVSVNPEPAQCTTYLDAPIASMSINGRLLPEGSHWFQVFNERTGEIVLTLGDGHLRDSKLGVVLQNGEQLQIQMQSGFAVTFDTWRQVNCWRIEEGGGGSVQISERPANPEPVCMPE